MKNITKLRKKEEGITLIALIITIIILLILAGITIATLTGENGILRKAETAKENNNKESALEKIKISVMASYGEDGKFKEEQFQEEIKKQGGEIIEEESTEEYLMVEIDDYKAKVDRKTGEILEFERLTEDKWGNIDKQDEEWYNYGKAKILEPKIVGKMKPIKYMGQEQEGNKWANAITADGSMWVWIPRFAYKITEGYHSNVAGKIEVAFLDINNNFLNEETGELVVEPSKVTYTNNVQNQWLVHPAFTANASNGGGFGEIEGIWIRKICHNGDIYQFKCKTRRVKFKKYDNK